MVCGYYAVKESFMQWFWSEGLLFWRSFSWRIAFLKEFSLQWFFPAGVFLWRMTFLQELILQWFFSEGDFHAVIIFEGDQSRQWFFSQVFCRQWSFSQWFYLSVGVQTRQLFIQKCIIWFPEFVSLTVTIHHFFKSQENGVLYNWSLNLIFWWKGESKPWPKLFRGVTFKSVLNLIKRHVMK